MDGAAKPPLLPQLVVQDEPHLRYGLLTYCMCPYFLSTFWFFHNSLYRTSLTVWLTCLLYVSLLSQYLLILPQLVVQDEPYCMAYLLTVCVLTFSVPSDSSTARCTGRALFSGLLTYCMCPYFLSTFWFFHNSLYRTSLTVWLTYLLYVHLLSHLLILPQLVVQDGPYGMAYLLTY